MINSVHISDPTIYSSSWTTPELRALFNEQARVRGPLVSKLQLGNAVLEALASRIQKTGSWSPSTSSGQASKA